MWNPDHVDRRRNPLLTAVLVLVVLWLALSVIGLVIKGLFYLFVIGLLLVVGTVVYGAYGAGRRSRR